MTHSSGSSCFFFGMFIIVSNLERRKCCGRGEKQTQLHIGNEAIGLIANCKKEKKKSLQRKG